MMLRGERVELRAWCAGDERALVRHGDDRRVWRNLTDEFPHPYTLRDAEAWIERVASQGTPPQNFAIEFDGEPIGGAGFARLGDLARLSAELGYWLGHSHWGRGLATEACRLVSDYAFENFDFERLQAGVLDWNPASRRVLEKCGYELEGRLRRGAVKDGQVVDRWLYSRLRKG